MADSNCTTLTRREAQALGAKAYFTGKPCKRGHISERTIQGNCKTCIAIRMHRPDVVAANRVKAKAWAKLNPERVNVRNKMWRQANPERVAATVKRYRAMHSERLREFYRNRAAEVRRLKPEIKRSQEAKRRANIAGSTPTWSSLTAIATFYKNCPIGMSVDHIVPLSGRNVSGLHVIWNLQYLTPAENSRKRNKFNVVVTSFTADDEQARV